MIKNRVKLRLEKEGINVNDDEHWKQSPSSSREGGVQEQG
jgi:hypothetical protein